MRQRDGQSGFGIVEALVIVVVIGIIGAAGFLVYQHNKTKLTGATTGPATANQGTQTTTPPPTPIAKTLDIKEWGVHMSLDNTTASLYYYINPSLPDVAYLSLRDIVAVAPTCAAEKGPLGAISRLTPAQHQDALSGKLHSVPGSIQIGNYWYGYEGTHADCTDGTPAMHAAVSKAAPNFDASTLQNTFNTLAAD